MKTQRKWKEGTVDIHGPEGTAAKGIRASVMWRDPDGTQHRMETGPATYTGASRDGAGGLFGLPGYPQMRWHVFTTETGVVFRLSVRNTTTRPIRLNRLEPFVLPFSRGAELGLKAPLSRTWFFSQQKGCGQVRPVSIWEETYRRQQFSADAMACLYNRNAAAVFGFVTATRQFGRILLEFDERIPLELCAFCDTEETLLPAGSETVSEEFHLILDRSGPAAIRQYAERTAAATGARTSSGPVTGWSTWDYYFGDISEDVVLENVRFLKKHCEEFPVEYIQVDAGYCRPEGMWTQWDAERFPHGPAWLARKIREHGFRPGLWLIPFFVHPESAVAKHHPDWLVKDIRGERISQPLLGSSFVLDGTHPGAQDWLRRLADTITREYGFEYVKMDGASAIGYVRGVRQDPAATGCEAFRKGLEAFRSGMAENAFLLGAAGSAASIGICDGMRVGEDVGARWNWSRVNVHAGERDRYHGSGNISRCIESLLNCLYMHGRFWANDGDYLVVRTDRSELTLDEARTWASVLALSGTTVLLSDRMSTLPRERLDILCRILPLYGKAALPVDFLEKPVPETLALDVSNSTERWKVVGLFNCSDSPAVRSVDIARVGLKKGRYHAFSFWDQKYLGCVRRDLSVRLEPHACAVVSLRRDLGRPQVIGTNLHIMQGGVEVLESRWDRRGILELSLRAYGRKRGALTLRVPGTWEPKSVDPENTSLHRKGQLAEVTVSFLKTTTVRISFSRKIQREGAQS